MFTRTLFLSVLVALASGIWWGYVGGTVEATTDPLAVSQVQPEYYEYESYLLSSTPFDVYDSEVDGIEDVTFVSFDLFGDEPMVLTDIWNVPDVYANRVLTFVIEDDGNVLDVLLFTPFEYEYGSQVTTWDPSSLNLELGTVYTLRQSLRNATEVPDEELVSTAGLASEGFAEVYEEAFDVLGAAWSSTHPQQSFTGSYPFQDCRRENCNCKCGTHGGTVYKFQCNQWAERDPSIGGDCQFWCVLACGVSSLGKVPKAACAAACRYAVCRDPGYRICVGATCNVCAS